MNVHKYLDGWMYESLTLLSPKQMPNIHEDQHSKRDNVHLWYRMNGLSSISTNVTRQAAEVELRALWLASQHSTTTQTAPYPCKYMLIPLHFFTIGGSLLVCLVLLLVNLDHVFPLTFSGLPFISKWYKKY